MKNIHAKSQCCGVKVRLFGQRRRQCAACQRTWRVRQRKRGRPSGRHRFTLIRRVFKDGRNLQSLMSGRYTISHQALGHRFRRTLRRFVGSPCSRDFPRGSLILLIDGLWFSFRGRLWTLYLGAVKPFKGNCAFFVDPLLLEGHECREHWDRFIDSIPPSVKTRVHALVSDNFHGSHGLAHRNGWIHQLCHFHLISEIQVRRGHWKRRIRGTSIREAIYQLIRRALELPNGRELNRTLSRLSTVQKSSPIKRLGMIARGFLANVHRFRAYRRHPRLGLPITTNTVESMGWKIRRLMSRSGNLRSPESLRLWSTAFIRINPKVACNGKKIQPIKLV
jgi:hypothetical protein